MFPHPLPAGKAGPSTQISGSRWRLRHRDTVWPCSRGAPKVPAGQTAPSGSPFIPAPAGHTATFHSSSSSSSSSLIPAGQPPLPLQEPPKLSAGETEAGDETNHVVPKVTVASNPPNLAEPPTRSLGTSRIASPGRGHRARAGQGRSGRTVPSEAASSPGSAPSSGMNHIFPRDQIAARTLLEPPLAPLCRTPRPRQTQRAGHGAARDPKSSPIPSTLQFRWTRRGAAGAATALKSGWFLSLNIVRGRSWRGSGSARLLVAVPAVSLPLGQTCRA